MPYPADMKASPKSAPIIKAGHTASDRHGTSDTVTGDKPSVRDLSITTSKR
jgi:hypothetical protein